ncbi:hypothetical protein RHSIM_Rhsim05G0024000 [Rhododendron simsii]|uniref:Uncharacterized protein n=1 Tax=Rhododendron simsii TaxID=118357 RepID=A0A834GUL5_RHOSS|nr:hypothetical protein RHSIM_Rhsim05G0024000 [Rhododendron simsii]
MSARVGTSHGVKECHENPLLGVFGTLSSWLPEDRNSDIVTNLGESTIAMMLKKDPRCCGFKARKYSCLLNPSGTLDPHQIEENPPNKDEVRETPIVFSTIDDTARPTLTIHNKVMGISFCVAQAFLRSRGMFQEDTLDLPMILVVNLTYCMGQSMAVLLHG